MNHYLYLITNNINGKKYIGKRSTKKEIEQDSYMGSGTALKCALKKHGRENFTKEILGVCDSAEEAFEVERILVCQDVVDSDEFYNMILGGKGFSIDGKPNLGRKFSDEHKRKISMGNKDRKHSDESKRNMSEAHKGKITSDETKVKMSKAKKGRNKNGSKISPTAIL